jgi:plasmid stabilization system protein ParE
LRRLDRGFGFNEPLLQLIAPAGVGGASKMAHPEFLIFYVPRTNGVSIVRVLYATQDWWQLFGVDGP